MEDGPSNRKDNFQALLKLYDLLLFLGLGFLVYVGLAWVVVGQLQVIPFAMKRMISIVQFLNRQAEEGQNHAIFFLGDSVPGEAIDCKIVKDSLGKPRQTYNIAWVGINERYWMLILPATLRTKPHAVVLDASVFRFTQLEDITSDYLAAAAWWNFLSESDLVAYQKILRPQELEKLKSNPISQLIALRSIPMGAIDGFIREKPRADLRFEGITTNFCAPWSRTQIISQPKMKRNVESIADRIKDINDEDRRAAAKDLKLILAYITSQSDTHVVVMLYPQNPLVRELTGREPAEKTREILQTLCRETGAVFLDYSELLNADEFADAVHPFQNGRRKLSEAVGKDLARMPERGAN